MSSLGMHWKSSTDGWMKQGRIQQYFYVKYWRETRRHNGRWETRYVTWREWSDGIRHRWQTLTAEQWAKRKKAIAKWAWLTNGMKRGYRAHKAKQARLNRALWEWSDYI